MKLTLGTTKSPNRLVPRALSPGVKGLERKAVHSRTSGAEDNVAWTFISISAYVSKT
jgi:hypothetical protein